MKTTKEPVLAFFDAFDQNSRWENLFANDIAFSSAIGEIERKDAFVQMNNH